MPFCCLAVSALTAGLCRASAADDTAAHFRFESPAVTFGEVVPAPLSGLTDAALDSVGRAMLDPERFSSVAGAGCRPDVKVLPAVPAAVVMTLLGFLCVTLARDRRAWLGLAGGLICLGQAGTLTAPQLMRRICTRAIPETARQSSYVHECAVSDGPGGLDETLRYVALLRKLAGIPVQDCGLARVASRAHRLLNDGTAAVRGAGRSSETCPAAPAQAACTDSSVVRPARTDRDIVCFSPAFIFSNLSRGPPAFS
jgi:hypothetical protein